ncbi:ATP-dependent helicase HrpB [bacterium]|nr:ATP-dependent helicase HrpB [bacterium]NBX83674.1 ATP-dependent helicase HrpB [bacterium]
MVSLPIDSLLPKLLDSVQAHKNIILKASPGSGKTTRVPPALLQSPAMEPGKEIWVLEPRRVAAKYSALRVAEEMGEPIGQTVGYHFRFENKTSPRTRLKFLTEGMFTRLLLGDPKLGSVGIVILDEFHERHIHSDIALSVLRHLQATSRPDLKLVVMSATLATHELEQFLPDSVCLELESPPFPLSIEYLPSPREKSLELQVQNAILQMNPEKTTGDFLVFLPGKAEIRKSHAQLSKHPALRAFSVLPLYGELTSEEQARALSPQTRRKIILSTNLAESSLTVEGVSNVIDSGLEKQAGFSWWTGLPSLKLRTISKASAQQRAGRAARTGPGRCVRLFSQHDYETRASFTIPEILRSDLAQTVLELKTLGVLHSPTFSWLESPSAESLHAAEELLFLLGATPALKGPLTALGKKMSQIPAHPRLSKLLLEAQELGCLEPALRLSAKISEGQLEDLNTEDSVKSPLAFSSQRSLEQYRRLFPNWEVSSQHPERLPQAVLKAFPDRVAQKRKQTSTSRIAGSPLDLVLALGGTVQVPSTAFTEAHDTYLILDVQESSRASGSNRTHARSLLAIDAADLLNIEGGLLQETASFIWAADKERVFSQMALQYGKIILEETQTPARNSPEALRFFLKQATGKEGMQIVEWHGWIELLAHFHAKEAIETLISRSILAAQTWGETLLPSALWEAIEQHDWDELSVAAFKSFDWSAHLPRFLLKDQVALIEKLCPSSLSLPNGRKVLIHYPLDRGPWIESRLQDFFGWTRTPHLMNGQRPITLHLLAPNQRAIQVTQDLDSFWKNHYPQIKKELSRKYPRHAWPDDTTQPVFPKPKPTRRE